MVQTKANDLIQLCNAYQEYLKSGASVKLGLELCASLSKYGLEAHSNALKSFLVHAEIDGFSLPGVWSSSRCHLTELPPSDAEPLDVWFDPYELTFMVRTTNPLGYGKAAIGWVSISPVFYWQYHVFQQLVQFNVRDDSFLSVDDLLSSRPFGVDKWDYASDLYHEEAVAYAFWHGKWIASNIRSEAVIELLTEDQLQTISPEGISYWNASFSGDENSRGVFNLSEGNINQYYVGEWDRSKDIGLLTVITDQVGLIDSNSLPRESGECLTLLNCSRKV